MANTLPHFLKKRAFLTPDRAAISYGPETLTFGELYRRSMAVAEQMAVIGIRNGSYTGILVRNSLDTAVLLFALQLCGAPAVMLNNRLSTTELSFQLKDAQAGFLVYDEAFKEKAESSATGLPSTKCVSLEELRATERGEIIVPDEVPLESVCTVMYTSGTTGSPKGVLQTYGNHFWSASGSALNLGLSTEDTWLCTVPLFHISGYSILMRCIIYGMHIIIHSHFDEEKVIEEIQSKQVTIMSVVGTTLSRVLEMLGEKRLPETFRCMLLGGGPAPLPLLEACREKGIPVYQTYGMTETASQSVTLSPEYSLTKLGSAGKPLFPVSMKIQMPDGTDASIGEAGEILLKGPNVTPGYLNRPEETAEKIIDGWLHTGDIGRLDEDGFLYVLDRRSDLIISGGENIYPAEIESVLLSHPGVRDVGVAGMPDSKWGQAPAAFIVPKGLNAPSVEELRLFCVERLAKYKVPRNFYFTSELPRNASNKLMRRKLPELIGEMDQ
ncbi:o-succinylbenzoate--CoA ligase [Bacillus sp. FJAT-27445]|uniref:o-succinylbenzoate--CoA ligase n=1 Tax=Bacillus sp. FJAT-27445 TaxID=1679166 RepID=UPI000743B9B4|nr:o-succinylbenzoate--CoA ligase [Bacillus sp. FJAT-27445]